MAKEPQKQSADGSEIADFEMGKFEISTSFANRRFKNIFNRTAANDNDADELAHEQQQAKELQDIERDPAARAEHQRIMKKIEREDLIRERAERARKRKEWGMDPFGPDEPEEEFEIIPQDEADSIVQNIEAPAEEAATPAAEPGKHVGGRPKGSKNEGVQGAEMAETRQKLWAEDTLVNLRSMLLTRSELLKDYGFSPKEMVRIFEDKPNQFMRDIVLKNLDKINGLLKEKELPALDRAAVSKMTSDQIEELLYQKIGKAASRILPEDLSPEWWRFLHDEVPVATDAQKTKLAKLMAEASKDKFEADIKKLQIEDKLGIPSDMDRNVEITRLTQYLGEDLESNFKNGLDRIEKYFIEEKTGEDLKKYLEKYDKLTDVDIFTMTKYYETMKAHYSKLNPQLTETLQDIETGEFEKEDYHGEIKTPDILEEGEATGQQSELLDKLIGESPRSIAKDFHREDNNRYE